MTASRSARVALALVAGLLHPLVASAAETLTLRSDRIPSGGATVATLTLGQAMTSNTTFVVRLSGTNAAQAVDKIVIAAGQSKTEFLVTAAPAATEQLADITVSEPGTGRIVGRARLTVTAPTLTSLVLNRSQVVGGTQGSTVTGTVTLEGVAAGQGVNVALGQSCSTCQAGQVTPLSLPATVRVPGGATTGSFGFETPAVTSSKQLSVLASLGSAVKSAGLAVVPLQPQSLSVSPSTIAGGQTATLTLTLNAPALSGFQMTLSCTAPLLVTVASTEKPCAPGSTPKTVAFTAAPGQSSMNFQIRNTQLSSPTQVTLRVAATNVNADAQTTLTVAP